MIRKKSNKSRIEERNSNVDDLSSNESILQEGMMEIDKEGQLKEVRKIRILLT